MWIRTADGKLVNLAQFGCLLVEKASGRDDDAPKWYVRAAASEQVGKTGYVDIAVCRNEQEAVRVLDRISALMRRVVLDLRDLEKRPAKRLV
jgi:hypothetical protein